MVISFLPSVVLFLRLLRAGDPSSQATAWGLISLAAWSALNAVGMAAARSGDLLRCHRATRICSMLALLANAGAPVALRQLPMKSARAWRPPRCGRSRPAWPWHLPRLAWLRCGCRKSTTNRASARETVQSYVATGNPELFRNRPTNFAIASPGTKALMQLSWNCRFARSLPVELRATPVALASRVALCARCCDSPVASPQWPRSFCRAGFPLLEFRRVAFAHSIPS